jgi:hypothetical protein
MKRILWLSPLVFITIFLFTFDSIRAQSTSTAGALSSNNSRVKRGLKIAPVNLNLQGKNHSLVGLGSYLVNAVSECNDCHTCPTFAPGHNPFDGEGDGQLNSTNYLAGGVDFGHGVVSANLTPDSNGKPAGLDFDEFKELIRTGHEPDEDPDEVLQVMPWPFFRNMTTKDLKAIYTFLSSVPHAEAGSCSGPGE